MSLMANNQTKKSMKKTLLVALALLMCSASFAQFRTQTLPREAGAPKSTTDAIVWGQIGTPFVAYDINGNQVDLGAILNSGMSVVIDYSCCWCGPCWNFHQSGVLEAINAMDSVQVIWVECESSNTIQQIYGTTTSNDYSGLTQGNWTVDANNNPVSYPIIDDDAARTCLSTCMSLYEGYVPSVYYISPAGYFCSIYAESYGVSSASSATQAVQAIQNIMSQAPRAGQAPTVNLSGMPSVVVGNPVTYSISYISVDPITSISWDIPGATPSTGTGDDITVTFATPGNYVVRVSVTNTTGTTTDSMDVNVIEWTWGNTMSYDLDGAYENSIGGPNPMIWGAKYPAASMTGRDYLENVQVYSGYDGHFTLLIYQTNPGVNATENDLIYHCTYPITAGGYNTLVPYGPLQLNTSKDLWVVLSCSDISYCAAGTAFSGDPNGSLVYLQGDWMTIQDASADLNYTWMIKATTTATAPALGATIEAPASAATNENVSFTAIGPLTANYSWTFDGGSPATATGLVASTSFATTGNHNVTLTATMDGQTVTANFTINIYSCDVTLPWNFGFESSDNFSCWEFIDQDGDGIGWMAASQAIGPVAHGGNDSYGSASYVNNYGPLTPDNYMITPKITIPAEGATIEWWDYGVDNNDFADHYGVFVSTTGKAVTDFTNKIYEGAPTAPKTWVKHSVSLAAFAGQQVYIAFRHYDITNMFWLLIDDLSITAGDHAGIENASSVNVALYPNPTSSILHISAEGIQEVSVLDINGRTVMTEQHVNSIDMTDLANGVYFVRVITNEGVATQKIVKK